MNGGVRGDTPREYDQFFTKPDIARECIEFLQKNLRLQICDFDLVLEPSFGLGAFVQALKDVADVKDDRLCFLDIDARDIDRRADFLAEDYAVCGASGKRCLTVGNPPFGKNASLAVAFFNKAASFSAVVAFILPRSFSKASVQDRLDRRFHLMAEHGVDENAFTFRGCAYSVPCVFQVWMNANDAEALASSELDVSRYQGLRQLHPRLFETPDFEFVTAGEEPDLAVRRVGVNAGRIFDENPRSCSAQSHFFIKVKDRARVAEVRRRLEALCLEKVKTRFNTAGCPSISKSELCFIYTEAKK